MPFLTQGPEGEKSPYGVNKTNWKYILIAVILAAIVGGGILSYTTNFIKKINSLTKFPEIKRSEKIVEEGTANWKIESQEEKKFAFEIKYPSDWIVDSGGHRFYPRVYVGEWTITPIEVSVAILDKPFESEDREFNPKEYKYECWEKCPFLDDELEYEIFYYIYKEDRSKTARITLTFRRGEGYRGGIIEAADRNLYTLSDREIEEIYKKMLSTFRFLEETEGTLSISFERPQKFTYPKGTKGAEFLRLNFTAGPEEDVIIHGVKIGIKKRIEKTGYTIYDLEEDDLRNVRLIKSDGSLFGLPIEPPTGEYIQCEGGVDILSFFDTLNIKKSQTENLILVADISSATNAVTFRTGLCPLDYKKLSPFIIADGAISGKKVEVEGKVPSVETDTTTSIYIED